MYMYMHIRHACTIPATHMQVACNMPVKRLNLGRLLCLLYHMQHDKILPHFMALQLERHMDRKCTKMFLSLLRGVKAVSQNAR